MPDPLENNQTLKIEDIEKLKYEEELLHLQLLVHLTGDQEFCTDDKKIALDKE